MRNFNCLLVTGGAGFIGSNFVRYSLGAQPDTTVVVLDSLSYAGNRHSYAELEGKKQFEFVHGDIGEQELVESLLRDHGVDAIVHFAAESHVDRSISGPDVFIDTNVVGTLRLLKAAYAVWESRGQADLHFHHVSTDEVYGSLLPEEPSFTESHPYKPNSPYAASKAASDHLVRAYWKTYGLPMTISNCSNNYGPFQFPEKLIPLFILNALRGMQLPIYGDGAQIRDWLFVEDHCEAIMMILRGGQVGRTYNVGGESEFRNVDLATMLCELIDGVVGGSKEISARFPDCPAAKGDPSTELLTRVDDRLGHDRRYSVDISRISEELGFRPRVNVRDGMLATIAWYLDNEDWWRDILDGSYRRQDNQKRQ